MSEKKQGKIIGIDLGTTNSVVAVMEGGAPRVLENAEGNRLTPSIVAMTKSGERLSGQSAKRQAVTNAENTIFSAKRLIGRRFSDSVVQRDQKLLPYKIREGASNSVEIKMGDKWYQPAEISAMVLQKLKSDAEERLGTKIDRAVITVPAYFDDSQRKATKDAGTIAGFTVERILNEPTAAALAYGLDKKKDETIVVYDFGGGTFDLSVLEVSSDTIEVKAIGGDTHLGGDDFDQRIIEWIVAEFKKDQGIDLSADKLALQRLREVAEKAKQELSSALETEINIPFITSDANGPKHLLLKLTRAQLEKLVDDLLKKSIEITSQVIKDAKLTTDQIDQVVLVGGQTKMPKMQAMVEELFGKKAHKGINPDEVVAIGAAVQAGVLQGDVKDVLLLDVSPLSLGIETLGGVMTRLIDKHTTIPTRKRQVFSTAADNQPSVEIHVLQGERSMAGDNKTLGRFILDGLAPASRGVPQIEVTFDIDANGILNVSAEDKKTGQKQSIKIEGTSGLSADEVERLKKDAEVHAAEDQKKREQVEVRNQADALVHAAESALQEHKVKLTEDEIKPVEQAIAEVKASRDSDDPAKVKTAVENLSTAMQKIGAKIYKNDEPKGGDANDAKKTDQTDQKEK